MSLELPTLRISAQGRDQLVRLKRFTGIQSWNVLCRWAFAASVAEGTALGLHPLGELSNVEMSWRTFSGPYSALILCLAVDAAEKSGQMNVAMDQLVLGHIHRGLGILSSKVSQRNGISDMLTMVLT